MVSPPRRWLWVLRCLALALAKTAVRGLRLRRGRIGRVIVVVVVAAAGDSPRHTRFVEAETAVVDSRSLRRLLAALDSQSIGPAIAIAIVGSLWRGG